MRTTPGHARSPSVWTAAATARSASRGRHSDSFKVSYPVAAEPAVTRGRANARCVAGPALMVYNDAMFTENDFKSIQRIGDSIKKTEETKSKIGEPVLFVLASSLADWCGVSVVTGRFGIGFNSVYHITELPSFVSSSYVVLLDPQVNIFSLAAFA